MMKGQARRSGLVMGFDTHMIAGRRACSSSSPAHAANITNRSNPHYDETLSAEPWTSELQRWTKGEVAGAPGSKKEREVLDSRGRTTSSVPVLLQDKQP
jgi:hypothetical protein